MGLTGMPWPKFLVLTAVGVAPWVGVWTTDGDMTGRHTGTIYRIITRYGTYELGAIAFVAAVLPVRLGARRLFLRGRHCDQ